MKGLILAGGNGSRLHPSTKAVSKQLINVYDKPMIFYPFTTLLLAGITDIVIVCKEQDYKSFNKLMGDGTDYDAEISYVFQNQPKGLAHAILAAKNELGDSNFTMILGDNIFFGPGLGRSLLSGISDSGATIYTYMHSTPWNYGVAELDEQGQLISIEEKPQNPKSNLIIPGLYHFDNSAADRVSQQKPSARGELEIVDLIRSYHQDGMLAMKKLGRGVAWFDSGTPESLFEATSFVRSVQINQGSLVGDPSKTLGD